MKLPSIRGGGCLCDRCVALCCRYFAFEIDRPRTRRDFDDIRWFLLHEDAAVFVEDGKWYLQVNRRCKALLPDNRCGIYENRPAICRAYTTRECDWHGDEYDYEKLFVDPDQLMAYAREYLAARRRRSAGRRRTARKAGTQRGRRAAGRLPRAGRATAKGRKARATGGLLKSA